MNCLTITPNGEEDELRTRLTVAGARTRRRSCSCRSALPQTARVMVKDEDICVHCGLCAERCPTAAWDMAEVRAHAPVRRQNGVSAKVNKRAPRRSGPSQAPRLEPRVNDFALKLANVNGTGSASANGLLMQAIFRMGIPVSGKNLFPSNIQGLPTWYEIRVNKDGHMARAPDYDLVVAMNAETYARDVAGGARRAATCSTTRRWPLDAALRARRRHLPGRAARRRCATRSSRSRASGS